MIEKSTRCVRLTLLRLIATLVVAVPAFGARGADTTGTLDPITAVAMRMPEFGGIYVDEESDTLFVYWRGGGAETTAAEMAELRAILGDMDLPHGMVVLPAQFSFLELKQWHDSMARHVLRLPGVTLIGIDDAKNRLLIGVEDSQAWDLIERVEQRLAELDIPREAVNLIEVGPLEPDTSLNDRHRPVLGGLQISFRGGMCTLGFNAIRRGILGFVTNSHCSARLRRVDSTIYYQPTITFDNQIGIETVDPRGRRSLGFFFGAVRFRTSDSNFSRLAGPILIESAASTDQVFPVSAALGFIARPALRSLAWDGVSTFRIIAERGLLPAGTFVTKVGAVTGRTQGRVLLGIMTRSSGVWLQRQFLATYGQARGDSGAPVIRARAPDPPGNPIDTSLAGIHHGSLRFPGVGRVSVFSPIGGVEADLGSLNTCAPPLTC